MGYVESGILNTSWDERKMYDAGANTTPGERSLFKLKVGTDNLSLNSDQMAEIDSRVKALAPYTKNTTYTTVYVAGKVFCLTGDQLSNLITSLSDYGYQAGVAVKITDAAFITSVDDAGGVDAGTLDLEEASGTTAAEVLASIAGMDNVVTFGIWNAAGDSEKTDTDVIVDTDYLLVTARNGVDYQKYIMTY